MPYTRTPTPENPVKPLRFYKKTFALLRLAQKGEYKGLKHGKLYQPITPGRSVHMRVRCLKEPT